MIEFSVLDPVEVDEVRTGSSENVDVDVRVDVDGLDGLDSLDGVVVVL
jgi:hypothetical protein